MSDQHQSDDIQNKSMDVVIGLRESSPLPSTSAASLLKKDASKPLKSNLPPSLSLPSKKDNSLLFQNRSKRCDKCVGCKSSPCGICIYCVDSQKYGGPGVKKQSCVERKCLIVLKSRVEVSQSFENPKKEEEKFILGEREIVKFKARVGCNDCVDCNVPDCKSCLSCLDKKFFGGSYTKNSLCTKKKCTNSTFLKLPCQKQQIHHRNIKKKATVKRKIKSQNVNGIEKVVAKQGVLEAPSCASISLAPNIPHQKRMKKTEKKVADRIVSAPNNVKVDQPQLHDSQTQKFMPPQPLASQNLEFDDPRIKILQKFQPINIPSLPPVIPQKRKKLDRPKLTPLLIPSSKNIDLKQIFDKIAFEESNKLIIQQQQPEGKQQQQTTMFPINLIFFETPKTSIAQKLRPLNISKNYDTPDCAKISEENGSALKSHLQKKRGRKPKKIEVSSLTTSTSSLQVTPIKFLSKVNDKRQTKIKNVLDLNTKNEIQIQGEPKIQQPQPKQQQQLPMVSEIELSKIPNTSSIAAKFWHQHFQKPSCLQQQPLNFYPKPLPPPPHPPRPSQINQKTNDELKATTSTRTPQIDPTNVENNIPWSLTSQNVYPRFNQINLANNPYYFNNFYESPMSRSARFQFYNPIFSSQDPLLPPSYAGKDQIVLESL